MKTVGKLIFRLLGTLLTLVLLVLVALITFLSVTEYKPADTETAAFADTQKQAPKASSSQVFTVYTWNTGYGGLGEESDFFMDGGEMVDPPSQETVEKNMEGIRSFLQSSPADAWLLQEVDIRSSRTGSVNQYAAYLDALDGSGTFAYNYKCPFVPIPVPPMGRVESGIATYTSVLTNENAQRISLPCPFEWPVRSANIKRCMLLTRIPLEGTDRELVLINFHLEAYDDGEGKAAQTRQLMYLLQQEFEKGNYVVAGGDFNQSFPGALESYPITDPEKWTPGILEESILPEGWSFAYDLSTPTCRLLDQPLSEDCQRYVIDGFILSPNVQPVSVRTVDLQFQYSDHNPVCLTFTLNENGENQ